MGGDLLLRDRSRLPTVSVITREEHAACRAQMERNLTETIAKHDRFRADNRQLDPSRWKPVGSRDQANLYREAEESASVMSAPAIGSLNHRACKSKVSSMRMVGIITGLVEGAISSLVVRTQQEFEAVMSFLHDDLSDCSLVAAMEEPSEQHPLHYLGYKRMVKNATGGHRNRDTVYLESTGIFRLTKYEDKIGYILMESVDMPSFPDLPELPAWRTYQSIQCLWVQKKKKPWSSS